ncbi:MAG: BamA/TamA family outer membrane protein [Sulfurovaceae bacterium]|nr:BamA/TamA family outer membrane protein [Sulfurovaceae bacterium]
MRNIVFVFFVISSLGIAEEKTQDETKTIEILGATQISADQIEDALDIKKRDWFAFWKDSTPRIHTRLIQSLPETLKSFFDSEGYYDATYNIGENNDSVRILISENSPVKVYSIFVDSDFDITPFITLKERDIFKSKQFVETKNAIIAKLLSDGYCSYDLDTKAYIDLETHKADLIYKLKKGDICTFGETTIKGADGIDDNVVLSRVEALNGEKFSTEKIKTTYQRLEDLEAFDSILINADRKIYNVVPVDITLKLIENPYYFTGGVGYDSYAGSSVQAQLVKRNFFGNAQKLILTGRYSSKEQLYDIDFFRPSLIHYKDYYLDFGFNGGYSNLEFEGFVEEKEYLKAFAAYQFDKLFLKAGMAGENINISVLNTPEPGIIYGNFKLYYPYFQAIYDARDDRLNPKNGYYLTSYLEYGLPYSADASDYIKMLFEARGIYTWNDLTFAAVGKLGTIKEISNLLPESKLFFGGGSYSNRAYGYNQIGVISSPTQYSVEGAMSMANLSLEMDFPIKKDIYGAVFTDNTMLDSKSYDFSGEIITSAGIGVRYITPVGPLKLDVGMNVNDISQYSVQFQLGQSF